jgi:hypothetical protein
LAFYIRKTNNGVAVWLKRTGPAIIWGPKEQALRFTAIGVARMTLHAVPKADKAEIETDSEASGDATLRGNPPN